jgi:kexin
MITDACFRDEDPVGEWSILVSDQAKDTEEGRFLGWTMTFWGSTIDASKAKKFEVPLVDTLLPPHPNPPTTTITPGATTKVHAKPTDVLPPGHGTAEGEKHKPAFPTSSSQEDATQPTTSPQPSSTPTPDEGWFSDMSHLVSDRKWFFGAAGAALLFGLGSATYFWRRRVARRARSDYTTIPAGDDVPMSTIGASGRPRTRELYDAFGEVSDDDEDADEQTGLRGRHPRSPTGLGFHSGFLEDDDPATAPPTIYKDEPEPEPEPASDQAPTVAERPAPEVRPTSPASGSGDGSWEHAS